MLHRGRVQARVDADEQDLQIGSDQVRNSFPVRVAELLGCWSERFFGHRQELDDVSPTPVMSVLANGRILRAQAAPLARPVNNETRSRADGRKPSRRAS